MMQDAGNLNPPASRIIAGFLFTMMVLHAPLQAALLTQPGSEDPAVPGQPSRTAYNPLTDFEPSERDPEFDQQRALAQIIHQTKLLYDKQEYGEALAFLFRLRPEFGELPEVMVLKARLCLLSGRTELGMETMEQAHARYPRHVEVLRTRADLLQATGKYTEALDAARLLIPYLPYDEKLIRQVADLSLFMDNPEQAQGYYRELAELQPDDPDVLARWGHVLYKMQRLEMAAEVQGRALALQPESADASNNLGSTLYKLNRLEEATAAFARAYQLNPDHPDALYNLAVSLLARGQAEDPLRMITAHLERFPNQERAWKVFWIALSRRLSGMPDSDIEDPENADAAWHHQQMTAFFRQGDWLRACHHELRAFMLEPGNTTYLNNLAALLHEEFPGIAAIVFRVMVQKNPDNLVARQNLDRAYRSIRLDQLARKAAAAPENAAVQWEMATLYADSKNMDTAIRHFKRACELNPKYARYHVGLSKALSLTGRPQEAVQEFQKILSQAEDDPVILNRMAWLLLQVPEPGASLLDEAHGYASRAVGLDRDNPEYLATLARVLEQQGKHGPAKATAARALRLAGEQQSTNLVNWITSQLPSSLTDENQPEAP